MLNYEEAIKIGIRECINKIGKDFIEVHGDNTCIGYGDADEYAFCYVGVSDVPDKKRKGNKIILTADERKKFPYVATCNVWYEDGKVEFNDCVLP